MLDHLEIWKLRVRGEAPTLVPPFYSPLLRAVLGRELHDRGHLGVFKQPKPIFRIANAMGNGRLPERWSLRLVTFDRAWGEVFVDAMAVALARGIGRARVPHHIEAVQRHAHLGPTAPSVSPRGRVDLSVRAAQLRACEVELASPTEIDRRDGMVREPTLADLLHATRRHCFRVGVEPAALPRFEDAADEEPGEFAVWTQDRYSRAQDQRYPLTGVTGRFTCTPTPAQAVWLALAEMIGVGGSTAQGMGVIRVHDVSFAGVRPSEGHGLGSRALAG